MKKYLSIYTLLALACIVLQSCLFSEEEIFDESSANRATADVIKCQEILKDVPNGWKLEYYIGSNYSAGAVTLLMKFDGKQVEMACESFDQIISKLAEDKNFVVAFNEVYPDGLSEKNITNAIQEFEKTLLTPNSRFDRYLKGQKDAITADEIAGYDLFNKYDCATCHVGEILGGQSYELIGVQHDYFADRQAEMTEEDNGRFKQTKAERDRHRFKVPGLRNIELTAPYFHDGSMATMDDAVRAMAKYQLGIDLPQPEVDKIVAFLRTLTGEYKGKLLTNKNMI